MTEKEQLDFRLLEESRDRARKQRDQYGTAYKALMKEYKKLKENNEILLAHNFIHMKQKADLQDYILTIETNAFLKTVDKEKLVKW